MLRGRVTCRTGEQQLSLYLVLIAALGVIIAAIGRSRGSLATFGAFAAVIIYGGIMNPAAAEPMLEKLDRIKVKYGLVE